ncbi:MAG TPA: hypothetical protein VHO90_09675 [Bacteroidales bacterium]|nr:hypothetical protein [Bacteroidales bacterium]
MQSKRLSALSLGDKSNINESASWMADNFNFDEYYTKVEGLDLKNSVKTCSDMKSFCDSYTEYFNSLVKVCLNDFIEETYKLKDNKVQALDMITKGAKLADAVILILPENEEAKSLYTEIHSTLDKMGGAMNAGMSAIQKKYVNKIVLSKKPIVVGSENEADFLNTFTAADKIYGMIYFKSSIRDIQSANYTGGDLTINVTVDGTQAYGFEVKIPVEGGDDKLSYRSFEILPDPASATSTASLQFMENHLKKLSPRKHTIKLDLGELNQGCTFSLDWSSADIEKLEADAKAASQAAYKNILAKRQLNEEFSMPSNYAKDPELGRDNIMKLTKAQAPNCAQVLKLVIFASKETANDWYVEKNELDIPKYKLANSSVYVAYKTTENRCFYTADPVYPVRNYEGAGTYGAIDMNFKGSTWTEISCANVK